MEAVILIGIQGSGKSTFYRERFADSHTHISLDVLKTRAREQRRIAESIDVGRPFVVDNTNVRSAERAMYIQAAKKAAYRVKGYFFETELKEALARNRGREGKAVIPAAGVVGTLMRLEPPSFVEGFDELYIVTPGEGGGFVVAPWPQPVAPEN